MPVWVSKILCVFGLNFDMELMTSLSRYEPRKHWINARAWSHGELQTEATSGAQRE